MAVMSAVSLTRVIHSLLIEGSVTRSICGSTTLRSVCHRDRPSTFAAFYCPGWMDSSPPRNISQK